MPTQATIAITPGAGQLLDAVSLVIGAQTVVRETMVIADPTSPTELALVSGGALHTSDAALAAAITANVLAVSLPSATVVTLTPPTAAAIAAAIVANPPTITATISGPVAVTGTFWQATQPISGSVSVSNFPATQPVSGTITANQGTSPWVVSLASTTITGSVAVTGTFWQATQPVSLASTTITGTVAVTQSTSPWVVSGTITANAGTGNFTVVQPTGTNLHVVVDSAPTTAVTGTFWQATQPVSGTITANQGTSPWVVSLASTTITGSVAVTGTFWQAIQPVSGTVTANIGTTNGLALDATLTGGTQKTLIYDGTNTIFTAAHPGYIQGAVTLVSTTITGTVAVTQSTSPWVVSGTITANQGTSPWVVSLASTTITGTVAVTGTFWQATQPVSGTFWQATQPISGTITANQGTSPWIISGNVTNTGTFAVQATLAAGSAVIGHVIVDSGTLAVTGTFWQATQPVSGTVAATQSGTWNIGSITTLPAITIAAAQTIAVTNTGTFAVQATLGASSAVIGHVITDSGSVTNATLSAETTKVIGTVNQGTSPWVVSGAVTTSGTATVIGTKTGNNAAPDGSNVGALTAQANAANPSWTEGNLVPVSVDLSGHQRVVATGAAASSAAAAGNPVLIAGRDSSLNAQTIATSNQGVISTTFGVAAADGQSATINELLDAAGTPRPTSNANFLFNGTTWDRARSAGIGNAVAATGVAAAAAYGEYLSTAPAPTTGQYSALQTDHAGSLFVKPIRRSTTAASQALISSSSVAVTVMPAQAATIFADISSLVVTVVPAATVSLPFTLTLSDGTATYIWDMETGALATSSADGTLLNFAFNPPLPATTAAMAWTIATNVATVVVHATAIAILQKAS